MLAVREGESSAVQAPQDRPARFFGQFLLQTGVVTEGDLHRAEALCEQHNLRIGEWAVERGYMSERQVRIIHTQQRRCDMRFGDLAVRARFLTEVQAEELFELQRQHRLRIGDALQQLGAASRDAIEAASVEFAAHERVRADRTRRDGETDRRAAELCGQFARLALRVGQLQLKFEPAMPWAREVAFDHEVTIGLCGPVPVRFGLGFCRATAAHLATQVLEEDMGWADSALLQSCVNELGNMLAGQVQRRLTQHSDTRIELPRPGELPAAGQLMPFATPIGDGGLIIAL